ncbi:metallophosphoesterase [Clostridium aminobutyricum]|uniref:Metallophosphoesterase n=1 Tax=Clostridium aminobutyricum TaxID=33953 RepID=A0A939D8I1_CLOAM|nr:metallophosphoesterase [Clostridium aminobutyricum]MBN7772733.1 metallophosphoesterase [Clostridium aminobutyricum]
MRIFAIADLHLSFGDTVEKPMDIYGDLWLNHTSRLKEYWQSTITEDDLVLIAGDISWALKMDEAMADLTWIHSLPGKKIISKGNHDLWWAGIGRLNKLFEDITFLQNDYYAAGDIAICGSRGWTCPGSDDFGPHDKKIYERELLRLEFSLSAAKKAGFEKMIGMLHYPPTNDKLQASGFTELFTKYGVQTVVYGHLHGRDGFKNGIKSIFNGVQYHLTSLDYLECKPLQIL